MSNAARRIDWKTVLPIAIGALILVAGTAYLLNASHSIFAEQCRLQCNAAAMTYKVRAVPRAAHDLTYPGECVCVPRGGRKWWEVWK